MRVVWPFRVGLFALAVVGQGATQSHLASKRGLAVHGDTSESDNEFLVSERSPVSWYYTWSLWHSSAVDDEAVFFPMIHGLDAANDSELHSLLNSAPSASTHLLTFNEPDHDVEFGGSDISPRDAARAYLDVVVPLRNSSTRSWNISHPVVTGSEQGIRWLRRFNESCYELDSNGCPTDFVAVHYYGDFPGLASWLGTLNEFYNDTNYSSDGGSPLLWITEMALPQEDDESNIAMMNESIRYLEDADFVGGFAWFGAFRTNNANDWTGDGVSLLDHRGRLTELGALYLGGEENGFSKGMSGARSLFPAPGGFWMAPLFGLLFVELVLLV